MATVNFTGSVDRDLLKRAKVVAAKADTSINALFNAELRYLVETFEAAEAAGRGLYRLLVGRQRFSREGPDRPRLSGALCGAHSP